MKSLAVVRPGSLKEKNPDKRGLIEIVEKPEPTVGEHDVKIKVAYCSICGSDPHVAENIFGREVPYGMGHEISGVIVEMGSGVNTKGLKVGDRVAGNFLRACGRCYYCQNGQPQFCEHAIDEGVSPGYAEYLVWDESQVWKIPDDVSLRSACILEPISIAVRVTDRTELKVGERVCIQGGGPIGLLILQVMKMRGATSLTLIEPIASRRELAKQFGADYVIDPNAVNAVEEGVKITGGMGYDVVVEVSGFTPAADVPLKVAANGAKVLYIAMYPPAFELPINLYEYMYTKNLTLTATKVAPYCFPRAVQLLPRIDTAPFTEISFPLVDAEKAFQEHLSGHHTKVLICCNEDLADK